MVHILFQKSREEIVLVTKEQLLIFETKSLLLEVPIISLRSEHLKFHLEQIIVAQKPSKTSTIFFSALLCGHLIENDIK